MAPPEVYEDEMLDWDFHADHDLPKSLKEKIRVKLNWVKKPTKEGKDG